MYEPLGDKCKRMGGRHNGERHHFILTRRLEIPRYRPCFTMIPTYSREIQGEIFMAKLSLSFYFYRHFLLSNSTSKRVYPQRPSGQAVVTCFFPSPPLVFAFIVIAHMVNHSHFSACYTLSICIVYRQLTPSRFRPIDL